MQAKHLPIEKTMNVIGLDLSTCAGVVVMNSETKVVQHAEAVQFKTAKGFDRVNKIASRIFEIRDKHNVKAAVIEDYAVSKFGGSAITSIEIGTVIRFCMWQDGFPYLDVSPTSLKKFVTGKGNAKKDLIMLDVFKRWGFSAPTNDIADAYSLARLGASAIFPDPTLRKDSSLVLSTALNSSPEFLTVVSALARCN